MKIKSALQLRNICVSRNGNMILSSFSLDIAKGSCVVICGPNGSGKTTLLRATLGLGEASGCSIIHGTDLLDKKTPSEKLRSARSRVGTVFQNLGLFPHLNLLENIILAPVIARKMERKLILRRARELLGHLGLRDLQFAFPHQISQGEQQRAALARALASEPEILLLDEPTSAIDAESKVPVLDILIKLRKRNKTIMLVTHELVFAARIADRMVFMDEGRIIEQGHAQQVILEPREERTRIYMKKMLHNHCLPFPNRAFAYEEYETQRELGEES